MIVVTTISALRAKLDEARQQGLRVGFAPTMGALHRGHASLVHYARESVDLVVASIFVNPTQFNDASDLKNYPRTFDADRALLLEAGCDILFFPEVNEMYPEGTAEQTPVVDLGGLDLPMEGASRPGHFAGVVRIVHKLFEAVGPCRAFFGQKDFQQLAIVRRMTRELALPVEVVGCPIVREADGLAMSSRNVRLTAEERLIAPLLYASLLLVQELWAGEWSAAEVRGRALDFLAKEPRIEPIYLELVDADTLLPLREGQKKNAVACIAARLGVIRLIDNVVLG